MAVIKRHKASLRKWITACLPDGWYYRYGVIYERKVTGKFLWWNRTTEIMYASQHHTFITIMKDGEKYADVMIGWVTRWEEYSGEEVGISYATPESLPKDMKCS